MPLLILVFLLVALAALGVLGFVLKVAFAVALGVFLAIVAAIAYGMWRIRSAFRRALDPDRLPPRRVRGGGADRPGATPRVGSHSEVTVLRRDEPGSGVSR